MMNKQKREEIKVVKMFYLQLKALDGTQFTASSALGADCGDLAPQKNNQSPPENMTKLYENCEKYVQEKRKFQQISANPLHWPWMHAKW